MDSEEIVDDVKAKIGIIQNKEILGTLREVFSGHIVQKQENSLTEESILEAYKECVKTIDHNPFYKIEMNQKSFDSLVLREEPTSINLDQISINNGIPDFKCVLINTSNLSGFPTIDTPDKIGSDINFGPSGEEIPNPRRRYTKKKYKYKKKSKRKGK